MKNFKYLILLLLGVFVACETSTEQENHSNPTSENTTMKQEPFKPYVIEDSSKIETLPSGLQIYIVEKGNGVTPQKGDFVVAHYHGMLQDGTVFDSSFERGQPFVFQVGMGQVIKGWDEGFQKLPVGTKAILIIPAELGYGERGAGNVIPPNATLIFHVQVLGISK